MKTARIGRESGSVFTVVLGSIALVAVMGATTFQLLSGPLTTAARTASKAEVDSQMQTTAKILIMAASALTAGGDCDADTYIEPAAWLTGTGPMGGGLVPSDIGATLTDPWGTQYGYCVWDVGAQFHAAGCGGGAANRLDGSDAPLAGNAKTQTVMALISAGADRAFQSTCSSYVDATTDLIATGGDDLVIRYTYAEAGRLTPTLWSLKSGDADTSIVGKSLEIGSDIVMDAATGTIDTSSVVAAGKVVAGGGVQLGMPATCDTAGMMRYNTTDPGLEVCDGATWQVVSGGGSPTVNTEIQLDDETVATTCNNAMKGLLRYVSSDLTMPGLYPTIEICDGTVPQWKRVLLSTQEDGSAPSTAVPGALGYFVITDDSWDGDLGAAAGTGVTGLTAANALCLADLTAHNWLGKADASGRGLLVKEHVRAFLCKDDTVCNFPQPGTTYAFAVSNDITAGGATFTAGDAGIGPNNLQSWAGTNYFNGKKKYWTGMGWDNYYQWNRDGGCNAFTSNASGWAVPAGKSNSTSGARWAEQSITCDQQRRLICLVHP